MKRLFRAPLIALALSLLSTAHADLVYSPPDAAASVGVVALPIVALLIVTALVVRHFTRKGKK